MKQLFVFFICVMTLYGESLIKPEYRFHVSHGLATDLLYAKGDLYIASDAGDVDIYNLKTKALITTVQLSKIKDFMGDEVNSKIFSLDMLDGTLLILSQDSGGYSRVFLYKDKKLTQILSKEDKLNIIKAKFIDDHTILIALISNDIISYDIVKHHKNWVTQASMSKFSSFALNMKRSVVAVADESGNVHLLQTKTGQKSRMLTGQNVDNIFSIDFCGDYVITGGQDRRAAVYNISNGHAYHKLSHFFVYGVGLSPSGHIGAYSSDLKNDVSLFDTSNGEMIAKYKATKAIVNSIYFIDEKEFFINSSSKSVGYYKVK